MKLIRIKYLFIFLLPVFTISCSKIDSNVPNLNQIIKVDEKISSHSSFNGHFFSADSPVLRYNKVYFRNTDKSTGQPVNQASLNLLPLMDMGTFKHACPIENPVGNTDADGYFAGAVLFSMAGSNSSWSLSDRIDANGKIDTVLFPLQKVVATNPVKKIVVIDSLSNGQGGWIITKHPVSLVEQKSWQVGQNTLEVAVHTMESQMSFPCCNEMTIEITPEMPSMGHGSPNNVNPVLTSNGHYAGKVNFTMTGAWRINMVFKKGGRVIGRNAYFDITF